MAANLAEAPMAKKKTTEAPKRDDKAVKIDRSLADKAGFIVSRKGTTMAEYLSDLIRPAIERDFAKAVREMGGDA